MTGEPLARLRNAAGRAGAWLGFYADDPRPTPPAPRGSLAAFTEAFRDATVQPLVWLPPWPRAHPLVPLTPLPGATLGTWTSNGVRVAVARTGQVTLAAAQAPPALAVHLRAGCRACGSRLADALARAGVPPVSSVDSAGWLGFVAGTRWDLWDNRIPVAGPGQPRPGWWARTEPGDVAVWTGPRLVSTVCLLGALVGAAAASPCTAPGRASRAAR